MNPLAKMSVLSAVALTYGCSINYLEKSPHNGPKEEPCLNCGKPKRHNNCYCSPECKRFYENKIKANKFAAKLAGDMINNLE